MIPEEFWRNIEAIEQQIASILENDTDAAKQLRRAYFSQDVLLEMRGSRVLLTPSRLLDNIDPRNVTLITEDPILRAVFFTLDIALGKDQIQLVLNPNGSSLEIRARIIGREQLDPYPDVEPDYLLAPFIDQVNQMAKDGDYLASILDQFIKHKPLIMKIE